MSLEVNQNIVLAAEDWSGRLNDSLLALFLSLLLCLLIGPRLIPFLRKLKFGQEVRDDGPQSHLSKKGTPTMGGIMFMAAFTLTALPFAGHYPRMLPVLFLTWGFGLCGFVDDYLKVVKHQSEGFKPRQKFACQTVITLAFALYLYLSPAYAKGFFIPFTGGFLDGYVLDLKWLYVPAVLFIVTATDNGVNFSDGVDGLCGSVTAVVAAFFAVFSLLYGQGLEPLAAAVLGSLLGFLFFNVHPARVFMGDTGSLALGGFVAGTAMVMQLPLLIPLIGFIYFVEVLSVILQVSYFKASHGKRIFRMAPIHHHFELGGWSETRVVAVFSMITFLLCLLALRLTV